MHIKWFWSQKIYSFLKHLYETERHTQADDVENTQFSFGWPQCDPFFWPFMAFVWVATHTLETTVLGLAKTK